MTDISTNRPRLFAVLAWGVTGLALAGLVFVAFLAAGSEAAATRSPEVFAMGALLYGLGAVAGAAILRVARLAED